jgi:hypothetical protein
MWGREEYAGSGATDSPDDGAGGDPDAYPVTGAAGGSAPGGADSGGAASQGGSSTAGSELGGGGGGSRAVSDGDSGASGEAAHDLPNDQPGSPVQGSVSCFEADYSGDPSFEVRTPTATYVILRDHGNIISVTDVLSKQGAQWIGYSDYRPRRVTGVLAGQLPKVVTTLDASSVTARHARLRSESATGDWLWVWDFYTTQATLTITRAPVKVGFTYRGTPGGLLDDADRLAFPSGQTQSATSPFLGALPGKAGWLYFTDPALGHSLFLIQHDQDELADRYDVLDGDSAGFVFGDGTITHLPTRFSLGLIDSTNRAAVTARAEFVIAAVH